MKDLVPRLRELSALIYGPGGKIVIDEAADAIEKLEAENTQLKAELESTLKWSRLNNDAAVDMGKQCRELAAELAAMREQKPVAWGWKKSNGVIYDTICADEHDRHEGEYLTPLYEAAGAMP